MPSKFECLNIAYSGAETQVTKSSYSTSYSSPCKDESGDGSTQVCALSQFLHRTVRCIIFLFSLIIFAKTLWQGVITIRLSCLIPLSSSGIAWNLHVTILHLLIFLWQKTRGEDVLQRLPVNCFRTSGSRIAPSLMAPVQDSRRWSVASLPSSSGYGTPGSNSAFSVSFPEKVGEKKFVNVYY